MIRFLVKTRIATETHVRTRNPTVMPIICDICLSYRTMGGDAAALSQDTIALTPCNQIRRQTQCTERTCVYRSVAWRLPKGNE